MHSEQRMRKLEVNDDKEEKRKREGGEWRACDTSLGLCVCIRRCVLGRCACV